MFASSSTIIEDLRNNSKSRLAYWYFQFNDEATQNVCNMIRSFIRQLSSSPLPDAIRLLWNEHKRRSSDPEMRELAVVLDEIIGGLGEVFIVIDALDECSQTADRPERKKLLGYLHDLLGKHCNNLHLLVTSRPEHDIESELSSYPAINIETSTDDDITRYVKNAVWSGELKDWSDSIKQMVEKRLLSTEEKLV